MTIRLLTIGKTDNKALQQLISEYENRLKHYVKFELEIITDIKNAKKSIRGTTERKRRCAHSKKT